MGMTTLMTPQIKAIKKGVRRALKKDAYRSLAQLFIEDDVEFLLCGKPDVASWRAKTLYTNGVAYSQLTEAEQETVDLFWKIIEFDFSPQQRKELLQFATGSSRLAHGASFTIEFDRQPVRLPHAHTCGNQLVLPLATSRETLRIALDTAIR